MDYKSHRWLTVRARILRRDGYLCQDSARYSPVPVPATVVHHIYPVEQYPGWAWEGWNLVSLSAAAHDRMHDRMTGKLTDAGRAWQRRTSPPSSAPPPW